MSAQTKILLAKLFKVRAKNKVKKRVYKQMPYTQNHAENFLWKQLLTKVLPMSINKKNLNSIL